VIDLNKERLLVDLMTETLAEKVNEETLGVVKEGLCSGSELRERGLVSLNGRFFDFRDLPGSIMVYVRVHGDSGGNYAFLGNYDLRNE